MLKNKVEVVSKDSEGKDITVYVIRPRAKENSAAQRIANLTFSEAVDSGALFRSQLSDHMTKKNMWDDEREKELRAADKEIEENVQKLKKGGIKLSEARDIAIKTRQARLRKAILLTDRNKLDEYTVEGQVENARFDCLVSLCTLDAEGNRVFKDMEDYRNKSDEPYAIRAASTLANIQYDIESDWENKLPENEFLKKHHFVNDDLQLIDKDGNRVSIDGKPIDSEGYYIDKDGNRVNSDGERIDENGFPIVEPAPFLDDDGNPIEQ